MGILTNGILGGFRKKTGALVGVSYRNLNVIRSLPIKSTKPFSQAQRDQQLKFGMVRSFLGYLSELVDQGYTSDKPGILPMNAAVSYNLSVAIAGVSPDFILDYSKICFSRGKLEVPTNVAIKLIEDHHLEFIWTYLGDESRFIAPNDWVTVLVYNPTKNAFLINRHIAVRADRSAILNLPPEFSGDVIHCYISFNSLKMKRLVSQSIYAGQTIMF